ncbi:MAG: PDZ domain-containing protein [Deltaproteobacteria bacterium]|nr:PDZ domain-containing protein [Deltaproteobacteria bacterium]
MKRVALLAFALVLLLGCAGKTIYPSVNYYSADIDFSKYESLAVFPFSDAPGSPGSGQIVQGIVIQELAKASFKIVERSRLLEIINEQKLAMAGLTNQSEAIEIGKIIGVRAIVVGEVGQYMMQPRQIRTIYYPEKDYDTGYTIYRPIPGRTWNETFVSISLRILDVTTGLLIFSGSAQFDQPVTNPPQQAAQNLASSIISHWLAGPGIAGFNYNIGRTGNTKYPVVVAVIPKSPAEKSGLKTGDIIRTINGEQADNISLLKATYLMKGSPGEQLNLEIQRGAHTKYISIVMTAKDH